MRVWQINLVLVTADHIEDIDVNFFVDDAVDRALYQAMPGISDFSIAEIVRDTAQED